MSPVNAEAQIPAFAPGTVEPVARSDDGTLPTSRTVDAIAHIEISAFPSAPSSSSWRLAPATAGEVATVADPLAGWIARDLNPVDPPLNLGPRVAHVSSPTLVYYDSDQVLYGPLAAVPTTAMTGSGVMSAPNGGQDLCALLSLIGVPIWICEAILNMLGGDGDDSGGRDGSEFDPNEAIRICIEAGGSATWNDNTKEFSCDMPAKSDEDGGGGPS